MFPLVALINLQSKGKITTCTGAISPFSINSKRCFFPSGVWRNPLDAPMTISAASGSAQKLNSAVGVTFPGASTALNTGSVKMFGCLVIVVVFNPPYPPMITTRLARLNVAGSRWYADAMLDSGPTARMVTVSGGAMFNWCKISSAASRSVVWKTGLFEPPSTMSWNFSSIISPARWSNWLSQSGGAAYNP